MAQPSPKARGFTQVDVFSSTPYRGNPVAVVLDADGLSTEQMQRVAAWTNLAETTFVLPADDPAADYRVRIFTPEVELPFAGHPTLGTCHGWLAEGGRPRREDRIVQECGAGLVAINHREGRLAFEAPPLVRSGPVDEPTVERLASALRVDRGSVLDAQWVDNGPGWVAVLLDSAEAVLAVEPDAGHPGDLDLGVVGPHPATAAGAIEVRALIWAGGRLTEDPVTGSLNASLAQWLLTTGRVTAPYVAVQGTRLGREGRVHVDQEPGGAVWVGGDTTTCIRGTLVA